jgi:ADP-ribose pyrophosphatase
MTDHPSLPGRLGDGTSLRDVAAAWQVSESETLYTSAYLNLSVDSIVDAHGAQHPRTVVQPHGAVGIVAIDDDDRVLLVEQYRHPVRRRLLEIPAGILDVAGESAAEAAARELAEEADLRAEHWESMLSLFATPGYSTESWQVFRAGGLHPVPKADRTKREAEEADIIQWWIPFRDAVAAILDGRIRDAMTVSAILATHVQRDR